MQINQYNYSTSAEEAETSQSGLLRPVAVCPVIMHPQIDVEVRIEQGKCGRN